MPPKATTARATDAEHALFKAILMNLRSKPDVDWEAVVEATNYSSVRSAMERFRQHRDACGASYGGVKPKAVMSPKSKAPVKKIKADPDGRPNAGKARGAGAKGAGTSGNNSLGALSDKEGGDGVKEESGSDGGLETFNEEDEA